MMEKRCGDRRNNNGTVRWCKLNVKKVKHVINLAMTESAHSFAEWLCSDENFLIKILEQKIWIWEVFMRSAVCRQIICVIKWIKSIRKHNFPEIELKRSRKVYRNTFERKRVEGRVEIEFPSINQIKISRKVAKPTISASEARQPQPSLAEILLRLPPPRIHVNNVMKLCDRKLKLSFFIWVS